mmetsp:Transcript_1769/g.3724  ORF Transcript_1769/g.3724 Transcript_1769/m.3724 type:complete len:200 (-) Transcript_1769:1106-1705(-)
MRERRTDKGHFRSPSCIRHNGLDSPPKNFRPRLLHDLVGREVTGNHFIGIFLFTGSHASRGATTTLFPATAVREVLPNFVRFVATAVGVNHNGPRRRESRIELAWVRHRNHVRISANVVPEESPVHNRVVSLQLIEVKSSRIECQMQVQVGFRHRHLANARDILGHLRRQAISVYICLFSTNKPWKTPDGGIAHNSAWG